MQYIRGFGEDALYKSMFSITLRFDSRVLPFWYSTSIPKLSWPLNGCLCVVL